MDIKFGTDGWRGVIAADFTFANLARVSAAVACYLRQENLSAKPVIVGHDTRFLSEEFARVVTDQFTGRGFTVFQARGANPTPAVACAIVEHNAAGAVMLTASHNPPRYHGFKFIPWYAGPALPHITDKITALLDEVQPEIAPRPQLAKEFDPRPAYFHRLEEQVDLDAIARSGLRLAINPMHGAGIGYLETVLSGRGVPVIAQCDWRDPLFGGRMPEPKPELLRDLAELVASGQADLGLALDGDADRFGIIDAAGEYILPNQVLCLLAEYLITDKGWRGPLARTVSTTTLLDRIAAAHGLEVIETPVGFKYQAQALMERGAILAGEESGGLSIRGHIPEKDGILACLLLAEIAAKKPLRTRLADLYSRYGRVYTRRIDCHCSREQKEQVLAALEQWTPTTINGVAVEDVITIDGWKYQLADKSWVLVRPSGTESLFRIYAEGESAQQVSALQDQVCNQLGLGKGE